MGIIGKLFGSDKVIDAAKQGIDKAFFTNEEKAEQFSILLKLYEPFKIAQRLLAILFGVPYSIAWTITFLMSCFGLSTVNQQLLLQGDIATIVGVIVGFYFGGGAIEGVIRAAVKK